MNITRVLLIVASLFLYAANASADSDARVLYAKPQNAIEAALKKELEASDAVDSTVTLINELFSLPESLVFSFGGDDGPLYDPQSNTIVIPYFFLTEIKERFTKAGYKETGVSEAQATLDALIHTLLHEFAHAAITMYELPVLGKEEDAADALATVMLIEFFEDGQEIALSAADLFDLESEDRDVIGDEHFWGEHSLDEQRYFSTLCHVYGSNPDTYSDIVEKQYLSQERAERCIEEYAQVAQSWLSVLAPHMRDSQDNSLAAD